MFDREFPKLKIEGYNITSPQTKDYNCIAWAAGDNTRWWWPDRFFMAYWPPGIPRDNTLRSFVLMFNTLGYKMCGQSDFEAGFEKIAVYTLNGDVTHASRQLDNGMWTSKLGEHHDIQHTFTGLDGPTYGSVEQVMKRAIVQQK